MQLLSGFIYGPPHTADEIGTTNSYFSVPSVVNRSVVTGTRWEKLTFRSAEALTEEDILLNRPYYEYEIWLRSSQHSLLMAKKKSIVEAFVVKELHRNNKPLRRTQVRVAELVSDLVGQPEGYAITYIHARISAFGDSMRSMAIWGDDLVNAQAFRELKGILTSVQCGLRPLPEEKEVLRVTNEGNVSFYFDPTRTKPIETVLSFLNQNRYLIG